MGVVELNAVLQRAHVVAQMQLSGGPHSTENACTRISCLVFHGFAKLFRLVCIEDVITPAYVALDVVSAGAMVFTFTGLAGMPTEMLYGCTSFVATPIEPSSPCSCTRTPLMT